jgi:bifunctional non-homologous end joining protein LigD
MLRIRGFILPAQPVTAAQPPSGPDWLHEIKHDGFRIMAWREDDRVRLLTRNGNDFGERYPLVVKAIGALKARSCLIDGEVAVCDDAGLTVFDLLRRSERARREAILFAFDLLEINGGDLKREPIETRKAILAELLADASWPVQLVDHVETEGAVVYEHACQLGCEGIVSKRIGSRYVSGRCDSWRKCKNPAAPAVRREAEEDWGRRR